MTTAIAPPLRRLPAPDREPPYDDEADDEAYDHERQDDGLVRPRRRGQHNADAGVNPLMVQGTLALSFVLPSGLDAVPSAPTGLRLVPSAAATLVDEDEFGPRLTARADLPEPRHWAGRFVQAVVEVLAGDRPTTQLVRWTTKEVYDDMSSRVRSSGMVAARPVVRSVHVSEPADGVAEVAALVRRGPRCSAVAVRLEGLDGRWQCTAVEIG